ncbi:major facilitator superfamily domain-containing protein [Triangularia verruculosa]|uniref:Major facilitator superfamily domain-containing protein n=1 Tax=Triangularia verruculosa TaxID=2587418 RepID=A0AAN6X580_9PEZI|nr:major facilitator superfamily domain-containing protein [Triangularia verruculosa]
MTAMATIATTSTSALHAVDTEPISEQPISSGEDDIDVPPPYSVWTPWQKKLIVAGAAFGGFFNPITAQVYLPALTTLEQEFSVTAAEINLTVTTYMIFQGLTPILFSGFTDTLGRRPGYIICFIVYISANIALALANDYEDLLVIRCFQSAGSATIMVICQAVVADVITSAERGAYIALTAIPSILGPSLGPVIGGAMAQYMGWRSIFWMLTIAAGINFTLMLLFIPETCRKVVGDGSIRPPWWCQSVYQWFYYRRHPSVPQNLNSLEKSAYTTDEGKLKYATSHLFSAFALLRELELVLLLIIGGTVFTGVYAVGTAMPKLFDELYDFDPLKIGLMYLPLAGGSILAVVFVGPGMNWNLRRHARKLGIAVDKKTKMDLSKFPIEKVRLEIAFPFLILGVGIITSWGWITSNKVEIEKVVMVVFFLGVGLVGVNNVVNALIVDIYSDTAGAALAAYNLAKCIMGAASSGFVEPLMEGMGMGPAFTLLGCLYLLLVPIILLVMWKGVAWRTSRRARELRKKGSVLVREEEPKNIASDEVLQAEKTEVTNAS